MCSSVPQMPAALVSTSTWSAGSGAGTSPISNEPASRMTTAFIEPLLGGIAVTLIESVQVDPDRFGLEVRVEGFLAELLAEAAHLEAAEGDGGVEVAVGVHVDGAGLDRGGHPVRAPDVPGPHPRAEAV